MIRRLAAFAVLLAACSAGQLRAQDVPSAPAAQLDPRNLALATEIIDISYPPETRRALLSSTAETMMAQARAAVIESMGDQLDEGATRIMDRYLSRVRVSSNALIEEASPAIFTAFVRAYARRFSHDDLVQIRAFVETPAGARFVQQADDLLTDPDVAQANTAYMAAAFAALQPLQIQLFEELRAHLESLSRQGGDRPRT